MFNSDTASARPSRHTHKGMGMKGKNSMASLRQVVATVAWAGFSVSVGAASYENCAVQVVDRAGASMEQVEFNALNDRGAVTGDRKYKSPNNLILVWKDGAITRKLSRPLQNEWGIAGLDIANDGTVAGHDGGRGLTWKGSTVTWLAEPGEVAYPKAINQKGQMAGHCNGACWWPTATQRVQLSNDYASWVNDINDSARMVGRDFNGSGQVPSYWFENQTVHLSANHGEAFSINNPGAVVGQVCNDDSCSRRSAFKWTNAGLVLLNSPAPDQDAAALSINDAGDIVGHTGGFDKQAVLWQNNQPRLLNELSCVQGAGWVLYEATRVNKSGQIFGKGDKGYFLLTPLP